MKKSIQSSQDNKDKEYLGKKYFEYSVVELCHDPFEEEIEKEMSDWRVEQSEKLNL